MPYADFIITNPPYLAKNKMSPSQKQIYQNNKYDDLYLLAIQKIIESNSPEGILIVPVNFLSAENSDIIRTKFFQQYDITTINYFKDPVFTDTTYNIISFHYKRKKDDSNWQIIKIITYPEMVIDEFVFHQKYNYRIAGQELSKIHETKPLKIIRLTEKHMKENAGDYEVSAFINNKNCEKDYFVSEDFLSLIQSNIMLLTAYDTVPEKKGWIKIEDIRSFDKECLVGKDTSRHIAYLLIPNLSLEDQVKIIPIFNNLLNDVREKYKSLFLTNFREENRKRISFELCYKLITYCYEQYLME